MGAILSQHERSTSIFRTGTYQRASCVWLRIMNSTYSSPKHNSKLKVATQRGLVIIKLDTERMLVIYVKWTARASAHLVKKVIQLIQWICSTILSWIFFLFLNSPLTSRDIFPHTCCYICCLSCKTLDTDVSRVITLSRFLNFRTNIQTCWYKPSPLCQDGSETGIYTARRNFPLPHH